MRRHFLPQEIRVLVQTAGCSASHVVRGKKYAHQSRTPFSDFEVDEVQTLDIRVLN